MKKKLGLSLGFIGSTTATFVPLAVLVSCDNDVKTYDIKASEKTDDQVIAELFDAWNDAGSSNVQVGSHQEIKTKEDIKAYWDKPEGDAIRTTALLAKLGDLWGVNANTMVQSIVNGGVETVKKDSSDTIKAGSINEYKIYLLNNIRDFYRNNHILDSLQKFDGFFDWVVKPENNYQNMKNVLVGGNIHDDFMIGIQTYLNDDNVGKKKVAVYPEAMTETTTAPTTPATPTDPAATNVPAAKSGDANYVTPIKARKVHAISGKDKQQIIDKWYADTYAKLKPTIDANSFVVKMVTDLDTFKHYVLATETTDPDLVNPSDSNDTTVKGEVGKTLREWVVKITIGEIWGITPEKTLDGGSGLEAQALRAFGISAMYLKMKDKENGIAWEEAKHIGSIDEYIGFLNWMVNPQEKYSNLRSICFSLPDEKFIAFQTNMQTISTDPFRKDVDLFAKYNPIGMGGDSETTPIVPTKIIIKKHDQAAIDKFFQDAYQVTIKEGYESVKKAGSYMDQLTLDQFKAFLLGTSETDVAIKAGTFGGNPIKDKMASDIGESLRTYFMKITIAKIWNVGAAFAVDTQNGIEKVAVDAFGPVALKWVNVADEGYVANVEKRYTENIDEYMSFIEFVTDSQEHYSNLRTLCGSPKDADMRKFQDLLKTHVEQGKTPVDIFA